MNYKNLIIAELKKANTDLLKLGYELRVEIEDTNYGLSIFKDGEFLYDYASGYYEEEVPELIREAVEYLHREKFVYVVTYLTLSDDDSNGYTDTYIFKNEQDAKTRLKHWRNDELEFLISEGRDYEVLIDNEHEFRVSWGGGIYQVIITITTNEVL